MLSVQLHLQEAGGCDPPHGSSPAGKGAAGDVVVQGKDLAYKAKLAEELSCQHKVLLC